MTNPNNSRISEAKSLELQLKFLTSDDPNKAAEEYLAEVDRLETPPPAAFVSEDAEPVEDPQDDVYVPPTNNSVFSDDEDEDELPEPDTVEEDFEDPGVSMSSNKTQRLEDTFDVSSLLGTKPALDEPFEETDNEDTLEDSDALEEGPLDALDSDLSDENAELDGDDEDAFEEMAVDPDDDEDDEDEDDLVPEALRKRDMTFTEKVKDWFDDREPLHQKLILGGAAASILLIISLILLIVFPKDKQEAPKEQNTDTNISMEDTNATEVGTLIPVSSDSKCPEGELSTPVADAFDPAQEKAWVCERAFGIDGAVATMHFDSSVEISKVALVPGFNFAAPRGEDEWMKHRVVTKVLWRVGDEQFVQTINPARTPAEISIPNLVTTDISMTVLATADPVGTDGQTARPTTDTFAISTITITGKPAS